MVSEQWQVLVHPCAGRVPRHLTGGSFWAAVSEHDTAEFGLNRQRNSPRPDRTDPAIELIEKGNG